MPKRKQNLRKDLLHAILSSRYIENQATQYEYELRVLLRAIGHRIGNARDDAKLSQAELAEYLKIPQAHISRLENGKRMLTLPLLLKLSIFFDVEPLHWLPSIEDMKNTAWASGAYAIKRKGRGILSKWQSTLKSFH